MCSHSPPQCSRPRSVSSCGKPGKKAELTSKKHRSIHILKPEQVSLGKCVACHQFTHQYSSVNQSDIVDLLRVGCNYSGFKIIASESPEEEGFVTMHHVLLLSTLDGTETKELCVQRINDYLITTTSQLKEQNIVVSDHDSVVLLVSRPPDDIVDAYYFGKSEQAHIEVKIRDGVECHLRLDSNVLFLTLDDAIVVLCFLGKGSFSRNVKFQPHIEILAASNIMLVTNDLSQYKDTQSEGLCPYEERLCIEHTDALLNRNMVVPTETKERLRGSKIAIVSVLQSIIWLSITNSDIQIYSYSRSKDLHLLDTIEVKSCFHYTSVNSNFKFVNFAMSPCAMLGFLMYIQNMNGLDSSNNCDKMSGILVMNMRTLKIVGLLEMELTLNRDPQLKMFASRDGSKLFVQEFFENRVIFYQVFSLVSMDLSLSSIVKRYLWNNFNKNLLVDAGLPKRLLDEVVLGF